ncbi:DNA-binding TFAR19-like protein [Schizosaccharomyces japonicus yFS275]|uniref:DNA-binding TFAR19-like protein n=1 Tax=Schizosaccharomyces japonicus (strain yFS275 / FY16936) TaxID=402676 RepID=B6K299_SCHJY|nr:DNA-binding TFAR19-like protein [Schizosaccharomyces japonicus yFS275]EEB07280.1 DNA-binding TFAR19-like protein [Schizosaccharomyces japonicus yFS275]
MDEELEAIRRARIEQLKQQQQRQAPSSGASGNGEVSAAQQEEMRHNMLSQILEHSARDRLSRIALVRSDRAKAIEELLLRMAKTGQIRHKITESELIDLLEQISGQETKKKETKIVVNRRKFDDDEDDWDL